MTRKVAHGYVCCQILIGLIDGKSVHLPIITCAHLEETTNLSPQLELLTNMRSLFLPTHAGKLGICCRQFKKKMFAHVSMPKLKESKSTSDEESFRCN